MQNYPNKRTPLPLRQGLLVSTLLVSSLLFSNMLVAGGKPKPRPPFRKSLQSCFKPPKSGQYTSN